MCSCGLTHCGLLKQTPVQGTGSVRQHDNEHPDITAIWIGPELSEIFAGIDSFALSGSRSEHSLDHNGPCTGQNSLSTLQSELSNPGTT